MLECVVNVSEGRRPDVVSSLTAACGRALLDVHSDPHHNRSVFTMAGPAPGMGVAVVDAVRALAAAAVERLDLRSHVGVHPRIGVVDVVPFVPLSGSSMADAVAARDEFAAWMADELRVPCFLYGPERTLPHIRRGAFRSLAPDVGPTSPHTTAGACAVGAREVLVAYNVWLADGVGVEVARAVARAVRSEHVRALGLDVGGRAQVSCNLVAPAVVGPAELHDAVAAHALVAGAELAGAELVGLVPAAVLAGIDPGRWEALDLGEDRTIEARLGL